MITDVDPAAITRGVAISLSAVILLLTHEWADYWGQRHGDAVAKGQPTRRGQLACLTHVGMYLAQCHGVLLLVLLAVGLPVNPIVFGLGVVVNGSQHYWADRRVYIIALARATGRGDFIDNGNGAGLLDQSWHKGWIAVVAVGTGLGVGI